MQLTTFTYMIYLTTIVLCLPLCTVVQNSKSNETKISQSGSRTHTIRLLLFTQANTEEFNNSIKTKHCWGANSSRSETRQSFSKFGWCESCDVSRLNSELFALTARERCRPRSVRWDRSPSTVKPASWSVNTGALVDELLTKLGPSEKARKSNSYKKVELFFEWILSNVFW